MKIILFTHPSFLASQSMPRFAAMLSSGLSGRGHDVVVWSPEARLSKMTSAPFLRKWARYFDQYVVFPVQIYFRIRRQPEKTLFVFADQALGPWIPFASGRRHAIHCHDFLAQDSARGLIPENPSGFSGKAYQSLIRWGYRQGRNFISVSEKTRTDLHRYLETKPDRSEVVYNGLNPAFVPADPSSARIELSAATGIPLESGYLLHVGANQWYKNRAGVVAIYNKWRAMQEKSLPLVLIGPPAPVSLQEACANSPYSKDIHLLAGLDDQLVVRAYQGASVFVFPSLAEGFGWPIAEAMASGCPVVTTGEDPMQEVAAGAAALIPRKPRESVAADAWAENAARVVDEVITLPEDGKDRMKTRGQENARRFVLDEALDRIEEIYRDIVEA